MNETVDKFLLAGDKFMTEMHLKYPGFSYKAFGLFTRDKERMQKFKETDLRHIYRNKRSKACFQHDVAYGILKILIPSRKASNNVLRYKTFKIWETLESVSGLRKPCQLKAF